MIKLEHSIEQPTTQASNETRMESGPHSQVVAHKASLCRAQLCLIFLQCREPQSVYEGWFGLGGLEPICFALIIIIILNSRFLLCLLGLGILVTLLFLSSHLLDPRLFIGGIIRVNSVCHKLL